MANTLAVMRRTMTHSAVSASLVDKSYMTTTTLAGMRTKNMMFHHQLCGEHRTVSLCVAGKVAMILNV